MVNVTGHSATIIQGDTVDWLIQITPLPNYTFDFTQFQYAFACQRAANSGLNDGFIASGTLPNFGSNVLATTWGYDSTLPLKQTRFKLLQTQTSGLQPGDYTFQIKAKTDAAETYTILAGSFKVLVSPVPLI
jgi:hypothetical protein